MKQVCFKNFEDVEKFSNLIIPENFFLNPPSIEKILEITVNGEPYGIYRIWSSTESKLVFYKETQKKNSTNININTNTNTNTNSSDNDNDSNNDKDNNTTTSSTVVNPVLPEQNNFETKVKARDRLERKQKYIQEMIAKGFTYCPEPDKIDEKRFYYTKRDKFGHVINTYKMINGKDGKMYLKVGVPKANGKDYTIRTYFITEIENFEALKDHEWKVYADNEDYNGMERYNVAYKYKDEKNKKTHTVKAIEVIAINMGLDKEFIKRNFLEYGYGIGTGYNDRRRDGGTFVDGKRICVFVKDNNDFLCTKDNLKLVPYAEIITSKLKGKGKNKDKNNQSSQNNQNNINNQNNNVNNNNGIKDMLKEMEEFLV